MYLGLSEAHHPDQENIPFASNQGSNRGFQIRHTVQLRLFVSDYSKLSLLGHSCENTSQKKGSILFKIPEQTDFRMKKENIAKQNNHSKKQTNREWNTSLGAEMTLWLW